MPTLISLCALSKYHWNWRSIISWNRPGQENWLRPWSISDELKWEFLSAFWSIKERAAARATEQFVRWTSVVSCTISDAREGSAPTNWRLTPLSEARWRITSAAEGFWGAENAWAPDLKIPALCHAILSIDEPSCLIWSIPSVVTVVTTGFSTIFVESYSPPWWVSNMAASTPSLIKVWNDKSANNWR